MRHLKKKIEEPITYFRKDFFNKAEAAYNIIKLIYNLKNANIAII